MRYVLLFFFSILRKLGESIMTEKRFLLEKSDFDLKYEFRVADLSRVEKTKEDFWDEKEEQYHYRDYVSYLYDNDAFLTEEEADEILNSLADENQQYKILTDELKRQNRKLKARLNDLGVEYYD